MKIVDFICGKWYLLLGVNIMRKRKEVVCNIYVCLDDFFYFADSVEDFINFLYILKDLKINTLNFCTKSNPTNVFINIFECHKDMFPNITIRYEAKKIDVDAENKVANHTLIIANNGVHIVYPNNMVLDKYVKLCDFLYNKSLNINNYN